MAQRLLKLLITVDFLWGLSGVGGKQHCRAFQILTDNRRAIHLMAWRGHGLYRRVMLRREADWRKTVREEWILEGSERKKPGCWRWLALVCLGVLCATEPGRGKACQWLCSCGVCDLGLCSGWVSVLRFHLGRGSPGKNVSKIKYVFTYLQGGPASHSDGDH